MKNIKDFILEGKNQWSKYIKDEVLLKFCVKALKKAKVYASDIQEEIGKYKDPDDLNNAYENDALTNYMKFENELSELLYDNLQYQGAEGDICDNVFDNVYDIMEELYKMTSK